jgi:hypothetical protein
MNPQLWWQVARAGGLVAYGLLAASTIWGLAVSTRLLGRWPAPGWTLDLHRYLGGLALTFTGIHLADLLLDSYIQFDVLDLLVPFAAAWRPGAVAWGWSPSTCWSRSRRLPWPAAASPTGSGGGSTSPRSPCSWPPPGTC